ncbi:MAG: 1-deoxy-D-xylulose-5-phosphate reductoisomerase [Dehalococcoidales bacterium]|nr:1-deoxy-D-xylulose-5-phosphate reductoisomerase [Dehalococcoidales bacterium]
MIIKDMGNEIKRLVILGSTGSIGQQALEVVRSFPHRFQIIGLAAGNNIDLLEKQIAEFKPKFVYYQNSRNQLTNNECKFLPLEDMVCHSLVDIVVIATSGKVGLKPTLAAIKAGKNVALANKEPLVMAGELITSEAKIHKVQILPIDSEHSAIWQCLSGETQPVSQLILTASGGPFRHYSPDQLDRVTAQQALAHPTWQMGKKVTIDSATLMNKGLEVIEARWLFNTPYDQIKVLIHPQSIIHSMVEFIDGSIKAQLGYPDMRIPIQYALSYPERLSNPQLPKLEWNHINNLTFEQPNFDTFSCFKLASEAGGKGGTYPAVLCAADEVAVDLFLSQRIKFTDIPILIEKILDQHQPIAHPSLEEIITADSWARDKITKLAIGDN